MNAIATPPATARQLAFIATLAKERNLEVDASGFTAREASTKISELKSIAPVLAPAEEGEVVPGMYRVLDVIYRVVVGRTGGNLYAKELVAGSFQYSPGAMRFIRPSHRMTVEEVSEYGRLTGSCCVCARTLTKAESIAAGIGPVCASRV